MSIGFGLIINTSSQSLRTHSESLLKNSASLQLNLDTPRVLLRPQITDHSRGNERIYPNLIKENRRMDLQTRGS